MWENEVLGGPHNYMNSMTSRETNRCHTVVGDVYNALCCDLIFSNRNVVLISHFFYTSSHRQHSDPLLS